MTCRIVYTSGRFVFSIVFVFNEKLNYNGQRLRRGKGSYIFFVTNFLNFDPLDFIDTCNLDCYDLYYYKFVEVNVNGILFGPL